MARGATSVGHALSESETLDQIIAHLTAMTPSSRADQHRLLKATDLAYALKRQASMGVHANARGRKKNPMLALFGNPSKLRCALREGEVLSHNVQAVLYLRDDDGEPYAHAYGLKRDDDLKLKTGANGDVTLGGLADETGMALVGLPNGEVVICDAREVDG
jgi:hypothetical protein